MTKSKTVLATIVGVLSLGALAAFAQDRKCDYDTGLCQPTVFSNTCIQDTIVVWEGGEPYEIDVCYDL